MIIISGIAPGKSGVGRVMSFLVQEAASKPESNIRFIFPQTRNPVSIKAPLLKGDIFTLRRSLKQKFIEKIQPLTTLYSKNILEEPQTIIVHPQYLKFDWCKKFINNRLQPTWLYLMDSSFFCIRSYNYIPDEHKSCLRCLAGKWKSAQEYQCQPYPIDDSQALDFVSNLKIWVETGKVKIITQNNIHANIVRQHFGDRAVIKIAGLWAEDWDCVDPTLPIENQEEHNYDVVFHGVPIAAKGCIFALKLAQKCPHISFLFPFDILNLELQSTEIPSNCYFVPMTWETGLYDAVKKAKVVLIPSLWSAPIEGALVKSIILAHAVAVVDEPTAFSHELPDGLILRLPWDISLAGETIAQAVQDRWEPLPELRQTWIASFYEHNRGLLNRLIAICNEKSGLTL